MWMCFVNFFISLMGMLNLTDLHNIACNISRRQLTCVNTLRRHGMRHLPWAPLQSCLKLINTQAPDSVHISPHHRTHYNTAPIISMIDLGSMGDAPVIPHDAIAAKAYNSNYKGEEKCWHVIETCDRIAKGEKFSQASARVWALARSTTSIRIVITSSLLSCFQA